MPRKDLSGQRFGTLTVLRRSHRDPCKKWHWVCRCDCGKESAPAAGALLSGNTRHCGRSCPYCKSVATHGMSTSPEYRIWADMGKRCTNKNAQNYKYYGGRGITRCSRWDSFINFYADMGPRPSSRHSVERVENNEGYSPDNCVWATKKEQDRNKRSSVLIEHNDQLRNVADVADDTGVPRTTLYSRIRRGKLKCQTTL